MNISRSTQKKSRACVMTTGASIFQREAGLAPIPNSS